MPELFKDFLILTKHHLFGHYFNVLYSGEFQTKSFFTSKMLYRILKVMCPAKASDSAGVFRNM